MHDGGNAAALLRLDGACKQHEAVARRVWAAKLEPLVGLLGQDARGKRAEGLAMLDLLIKDIAHVRPARVGKQRTVAERTWPKFHAALKPRDDFAVGDHVR